MIGRRTVLGALAAGLSAALWLAACANSSGSAAGGSFACDNPGPCPMDPSPTPQSIQACQSLQSDPVCGSLFTAAENCNAAQPSACNAQGMSEASPRCQAQTQAYGECRANALTDGGAPPPPVDASGPPPVDASSPPPGDSGAPPADAAHAG
jgi:hypothetical protein